MSATSETSELPNSLEAEQGLLGSMMIAPGDVCPKVESLSPSAFYLPAHQTICRLVKRLHADGAACDFITVTQALRDAGKLDEIGGSAAVTHLFTSTPTSANAGHYLDIVREKAAQRAGVTLSEQIRDASSHRASADIVEALESAAREVREIATDPDAHRAPEIKNLVMDAIERLEQAYEHRGTLSGLPTGFKDLDRLTGGLQAADMIVIAARPSMGKTALAMNIAEHVAVVVRHPVAVFSLEMSNQQLVQRLLCSRARVNLQKVRDGFLSERDFPNLSAAAFKLGDSPLHIDDTAALTVQELRSKARQMRDEHGIKLIVVDYLQLMRGTSRQAANSREREISECSAGIKALGKELNVPIIVLAQLNREVEGRHGGRPRLADIRESGSIEQDADVVALLYRPEVYEDDEEAKAEKAGEAELIIAKQRNGPIDDVKLTFLKEFTRFEDRASAYQQQQARLPHNS
jgi:replicative DNA helicase